MLLVENLFGPISRTDKKMSSGDMTAKLLQNREILTYFRQLNVAEQGVDKKMSRFLATIIYSTLYIRFRAFSYRMLEMGK